MSTQQHSIWPKLKECGNSFSREKPPKEGGPEANTKGPEMQMCGTSLCTQRDETIEAISTHSQNEFEKGIICTKPKKITLQNPGLFIFRNIRPGKGVGLFIQRHCPHGSMKFTKHN